MTADKCGGLLKGKSKTIKLAGKFTCLGEVVVVRLALISGACEKEFRGCVEVEDVHTARVDERGKFI